MDPPQGSLISLYSDPFPYWIMVRVLFSDIADLRLGYNIGVNTTVRNVACTTHHHNLTAMSDPTDLIEPPLTLFTQTNAHGSVSL